MISVLQLHNVCLCCSTTSSLSSWSTQYLHHVTGKFHCGLACIFLNSTSDHFISGFDSYMSTMVIFPDKLFSRLFQDYNPSTSNLHFYTLLPLASVYIKYLRQIIFLMVLILNFLVCINLQNLNNPHMCLSPISSYSMTVMPHSPAKIK